MAFCLHPGLAFCSYSVRLSLTGFSLGTLSLSRTLGLGSLGLSLQSGFPFAGSSYSSFVLAGCRLSSRLFPGQFFCSLLCGSLGSRCLAASFCFGTRLGLGHLLSHQTVNLCIEFGVFLALFGYNGLYGFLLFLQRVDHFLLFCLLSLQGSMFLPAFVQQHIFRPTHLVEFFIFGIDLCLLGLHYLTLGALVGGIFSYKSKTAIHLCHVFGTKDKHQFVLYGAIAGQILHGFGIFCLSLFQLCLQGGQLVAQHHDVSVKMADIVLDIRNRLLTLVDFTIDGHQVTKPFLHISLVGTQQPLLFLDFLLHISTFVFQTFDGWSIVFGRFLLGRGLFLLALRTRRCLGFFACCCLGLLCLGRQKGQHRE